MSKVRSDGSFVAYPDLLRTFLQGEEAGYYNARDAFPVDALSKVRQCLGREYDSYWERVFLRDLEIS